VKQPEIEPFVAKIAHHSNRGFALVISMILLVIAAGLGITILGSIAIESKMQRNSQDILVAQRAANFATSQAQKYLLNSWCYTSALCTSGPCATVWNNTVFSNFDPAAQNWSNGTSAGVFPGSVGNPLYIIVYLGYDQGNNVQKYMIMSQGKGTQSTTLAFDSIMVTVPTLNCGSNNGSTFSIRVRPSINGTQQGNRHLPPVSKTPDPGFYTSTVGVVCPNKTYTAMAWCESDGLRNARVAGWSSQDTSCLTAYGAWVANGGTSSITLQGNTLSCRHRGTP
jgi:type II secretory pathway pseudopilin PulG